MPNLRKLRLERVTPWMTNDELAILTQNCVNLVELSLLGCRLLNSGWHLLYRKHAFTLLYIKPLRLGSSGKGLGGILGGTRFKS